METHPSTPETTIWITTKLSCIQLDVLSCRLGAVCACLSSVLVGLLDGIRRYEILVTKIVDWGGRGLIFAMVAAGIASFVTGIAALYQGYASKRFAVAGIVLPFLALPLAFSCVQGYLFDKIVEHSSWKCRVHIQYVGNPFWQLARKTPDVVLPATADLKTVLLSVTPDFWDRRSVDTFACACPESYIRNREIGYIYIGDGLRLGDVVEKNIPIIFCPASNHRDRGRICFGWPCGDCGMSNETAIALFEDALARSKSGEFSYSLRAIAVLEREIAARKAPPPGIPRDKLLLSAVLGLAGLIVGVEVFFRKRIRSESSIQEKGNLNVERKTDTP